MPKEYQLNTSELIPANTAIAELIAGPKRTNSYCNSPRILSGKRTLVEDGQESGKPGRGTPTTASPPSSASGASGETYKDKRSKYAVFGIK